MKKALKLLICMTVLLIPIVSGSAIEASAATAFSDVPSSHRAYDEITYLSQGEIVLGSNGKYKPNDHLTRAEAVSMVGRAIGLSGTKTETSFSDVGKSSFASGYIQSAVKAGIVSGYSNGTFQPDAKVTRGEMALIICRAFGYSATNGTAGAGKVLMSKGIASGTGNGSFGESAKIIRADYAVFLARAINHEYRTGGEAVSYSTTKTVNASSLNIRKGPNTNYAVVGSVAKGAKVSVAYTVGSWSYIKNASGVKGFVSSSYLSASTSSGSTGGTGLASQTIVIDPGHGGTDPGAVALDTKEKDVVLQVGLKLKPLLEQTPINIVYTRTTDKYLTLAERVEVADQVNANLFVSIHANSSTNTSANGSEVYFYSKSGASYSQNSQELAEKIQERFISMVGTTDRGTKEGNYYVLRENSRAAVLVELAFINNSSDNSKLTSSTYQQRMAKAIYYGILDYYGENGYSVSSYY